MELKHTWSKLLNQINCLLIVPYGIETISRYRRQPWRASLLIVPYGIETVDGKLLRVFSILLIVPYGIETGFCLFTVSNKNLLIVPYGIETNFSSFYFFLSKLF